MQRCLLLTLILLLCLSLPAGCPVAYSGAGAAPGGSVGSGTGGGGGSSSGADTAAGGTVQPDGLEVQFPGCAEAADGESWRAEVLSLVNQERAAHGLSTLVVSETLEAQADQYACEMIYYDFFDHVNPATGTELPDRAGEFGYEYYAIGENLAAGQRSPIEVMRSWMNSPGHRDNILNPVFAEIGIGVRAGGAYEYYWVQEFGMPR